MLTLCHNFFRVLPNNKSSKDVPQVLDKRKYAFGILILFIVVVLWVLSSEVTKYLYQEKKLERPFLITYIRSSLLFIYLIVLCFTPPTKDPCKPADYTQLLEQSPETDDENFCNEINNSLSDSTFVPVRAGEATDSDDATPRAVRFNKVAEVRVMSAAQAGEALLARLSWAASVRASQTAQRRAAAAATTRHLRAAAALAAPWFLAQYLFRLALLHTSAGAATLVTASAGSLTAAAGAAAAHAQSDALTPAKCLALVCTLAALTTLGAAEGGAAWAGALAAAGAAASYAAHLLLYRRELRRGDGINTPLLTGLVGGVSLGAGWALGGALAAAGVEPAALPPAPAAPALLLDALLAPLLADSLYLWGQSLTSARAASAMLSLAAPLAAAVEWWRGAGGAGGGWRVLAAALAALGWLLAVVELPAWRVRWPAALRAADPFSSIRNLPDLDEQSEALISAEEPT